MTGYIQIDCKGMNLLAQESQTITGLYAASAAAMETNKPVIAVNCTYGEGVDMSPVPVMGIYEDDDIIFTASILQIIVTPADAVTIRSLVTPPANSTRKSSK